jgi:hypothetical protein
MEKCPDCGKQFKSPQALAGHRRWAHQPRPSASMRKVKIGPQPLARQAANAGQRNIRPPQVTVRIGDRDLTPQQFQRLVDDMLVVRAALTRAR